MSKLKRVRYFTGQLLTAEDLTAEQEYLLERQRRRNRQFVEAGIVSGLQVSVDGESIRVEPGMAIDGRGNEIVIDTVETLPLPLPPDCRFRLVLRYRETLTDPIPAQGDDMGSVQFSRIEEGYALELVPPATVPHDGLVLADGRNRDHGWEIMNVSRASCRPAAASRFAGLAIFALIAALLLGRKNRVGAASRASSSVSPAEGGSGIRQV
jgi:hypothetical protein